MSRSRQTPSTPSSAAPVAAPLFPRMPVDEIVDDLRLFEHPMTREALRNPSAESVRSVFFFFVAKLYGLTDDDLRQSGFRCLDVLANPDLHDEAVPVLHVLDACLRMFRAARYNDGFGLSDLIAPEPKRFLWQMSALINFAKFREKRVRELQEINEAAVAVREKGAELDEVSARVDGEISETEAAREAVAGQVADEESVVEEHLAEVGRLHQAHIALSDETKSSKAKLQETVQNISKLKFRHLALDHEAGELKSGIVTSPDRVQSEIRKMEERAQGDKKALVEKQARTRDADNRRNKGDIYGRDLTVANKLTEEFVGKVDHFAEADRRVQERTAKKLEFDTEMQGLEDKRARMTRQLATLEERREAIRKQREENDGEDRRAAAVRDEEARNVDRDVAAAKEVLAKNDRRVNEIEREMEQLVGKYEAEVTSILRKLGIAERVQAGQGKEIVEKCGIVDGANRKALEDLQNTIAQNA